VWTAVCAFAGLGAAYVLLFAERNALLKENKALLAEKNTKQPPPAGPRATPPTAPAGRNERDLLPRKS
jgi:hypothetical protein